jgi:hypothetical protein
VSTKSIDFTTNVTTPFNSRILKVSARESSQRKYHVIGENNLEPNTNRYQNAYYVHIVLRKGFQSIEPMKRDPLYGADYFVLASNPM